MNVIEKLVNLLLLLCMAVPLHPAQSSLNNQVRASKSRAYYLNKIKKSIKKNNDQKFLHNILEYRKEFGTGSANDTLCAMLANKPKFLRQAIDWGFVITEAEAISLLKKTKKTATVDIILASQPINSFWLGVTSCNKIADYLLEKGANINEKMWGRVPLAYVFFAEYHKPYSVKDYQRRKKHYMHLRANGADEKAVRHYFEDMVEKFCCGNDFLPYCQSYQEMLSTFEDFENKAHKKLHTDIERQ